ncbi:MAG: DUF4399 domain-containing protein [Nitrospinae bacterium]|nr:DUF4399 domain-containing protein [Nitrospinota bacterium]
MKLLVRVGSVFMMVLLVGCASQGGGGESAPSPASGDSGGGVRVQSADAGVTITQPASMAELFSPVEVCMETKGYTVEPAKNGVNEGKGHHHLIVNVNLPDLNQPVPKDSNHIHMGDGSKCKKIELSSGMHTVQALFARGNHIPYDPAVTDSVVFFVK